MPDTLSWFWAKQSLLSCLTHYPDSEPSSLYSHAWHIILILSQAVFALMPDTLSWFWAKQSFLSCLTHYPDSEPSSLCVRHESKDCLAQNQDNVSGMRAKTVWLRIRIMEPSSLCSHAWHIILILSQAVFTLMPDTLSWFWAKQSLLSCLTYYPDSEPSSLYSHAWHIILILSQAVFVLTAWLRIRIMCQAWE
jgi:hypothetical protein